MVAAGGTGKDESSTAENRDRLVCGQARSSAVTQPLPRPTSRSAIARCRRVRDTVESPPRYRAAPPLPSLRPTYTLAVQDIRRSSSPLPDHTLRPRGTSWLQV